MNRLMIGLLGSVSLLQAAPAWCQSSADEEASGLQDIVVTARRREESLQDVPVAVSVITQAQLQNNLASDLLKIAELAPQVIIGRQTVGTGAVIGIRGISSTATDPGLDQSVAVAIDNVVLSGGRIVTAGMFDLAQVEVMEGPQALFFGKNSPAGVISLRSAGPGSYFEGYLRGGYEFNADERFLEGAVSGPLSDTLGARIAFRASEMEGWLRNVAQPVADPTIAGVTVPGASNGRRQPEGRDIAARLTATWKPTDTLDVELKALVSHQRNNSSTGYVETFCNNGRTQPTLLGTIPLPFADCKKNQVKAEGGLPDKFAANYPHGHGGVPFYRTDAVLGSLTISKDFSNATLTSTTGYYQQDFVDNRNADFTPFSKIWSVQEEDYELITQEVRFNTELDGPFNLMAGGYYEDAKRFFGNYPDLFHAGLNVAANNYTTVEAIAHAKSRSYSLFGQVRWKILPSLELTAGARYSNDRKSQAIYNRSVGVTTLPLRPAGDVLHARLHDDNVSPEVTLSWKPAEDQLLYAAYKSGYKAGAISTAALLLKSATSDNVKVGAEKAHGFEAGYKAELLDRHLRFDIAAYQYRYSDLQLGTFDPVLLSFRIQNAAVARTRGIQASLNWLVTDAFTLKGNIGYNKARYRRFADAQCYPGQTAAQGCASSRQSLTGERLTRAPDLSFNIGGEYNLPVGEWSLKLSADGTYTSKYQTAADNAPAGMQQAFWRLNAAVRVSAPGDHLSFSLIGRNLTDSYSLVGVWGRPAATTSEWIGVFNRPREVALQAEYKF